MKFQKGGLFKYLIDKQIEDHDKYYNDYGLKKPNSEKYLKKAKYYFKQPNTWDKVTGTYYYIKSDPLNLYGLKKGIQQDIRKLQREDERTLSNLKLKLFGFQKGGQAPSALDRYKGSTKFQFISNDNRVRQILAPRTSAFSLKHPAMIEQRISSDGQDTTYAEFPEHTSLVKVKPRIAKNDWTLKYNGKKEFNNSPEYNILKRRFNQASLVSSTGNFTPWSFNKYQILSSFNNKLK